MDETRDVAFLYAQLLRLFCTVRRKLGVLALCLLAAHWVFLLLFDNPHDRFHRIIVIDGGLLGNDADLAARDFELYPIAAPKPGLPAHRVRDDDRLVVEG